MKIGKETWLIIGLLSAMLAAAIVAFYLPQGRKLSTLQAQASTMEQTLKQDSQKAMAVPAMLREIESLRGRYRDFDHRLPKNKELGGFLSEISNNLSEEALTDTEIIPGNPAAEELYNTLPIVMKSRGSFLSLANFLQRISKMQRLTRVHTLRIDSDGKSPQPKVEMQLNIYFAKS